MKIIWNGDIFKTASFLKNKGAELRWFGVTVGQVGFGVLVSVECRTTTSVLPGEIYELKPYRGSGSQTYSRHGTLRDDISR